MTVDGAPGSARRALNVPPAFTPVESWPLLPHGVSFGGDANAVAVDSRDRVYVFNRGPMPVLVFDADGDLLDGWGEGEFDNPHAVTVDADDNLLLVDSRVGHFVDKRTPEGELLFRIGLRGVPAKPHSGEPFNGPTDIAVHASTGELFVTDGYGNARVHRFSADGEHILSWGESGGYEGQFCVPHSVTFLDDEHLVVCDRENFRLQVFSVDGEFVEQWHAFRPCAVERSATTGRIYVAELGPDAKHHGHPNLGSRITVLNEDGLVLTRIGSARSGLGVGEFFAPHSLALDSRENIYVAEVTLTWTMHLGLPRPPGEPVSLRKWSPAA